MDQVVSELLQRTRDIVERHTEQSAKHAADFNVFEILGRTDDEVKCHSAFIACLLDPQGSHGQKSLFLKPFLDRLRNGISPDDQSVDWITREGTWRVGTEVAFDKGKHRIDILLEAEESIIAIENKIYADDQDGQMRRYKEKIDQSGKRNRALVYLTLDRRKPSDRSL
ncbi:PD-(D/E)XK nuclease family protein, partial [Candidatus Sumerlaeota bacterium]